jgi:hypothetical protein
MPFVPTLSSHRRHRPRHAYGTSLTNPLRCHYSSTRAIGHVNEAEGGDVIVDRAYRAADIFCAASTMEQKEMSN